MLGRRFLAMKLPLYVYEYDRSRYHSYPDGNDERIVLRKQISHRPCLDLFASPSLSWLHLIWLSVCFDAAAVGRDVGVVVLVVERQSGAVVVPADAVYSPGVNYLDLNYSSKVVSTWDGP